MKINLKIPGDVHKQLMIEMLWNQENTQSQPDHKRDHFVVMEESVLNLPFIRLWLALVVSGDNHLVAGFGGEH